MAVLSRQLLRPDGVIVVDDHSSDSIAAGAVRCPWMVALDGW
ncbi:MAG: hypothetical protein ACK46L_12730 [Synechococcaceae cyanobacterium]